MMMVTKVWKEVICSMIGVAAFWKVICQGDGCPSPASAGPLSREDRGATHKHRHSFENRHSVTPRAQTCIRPRPPACEGLTATEVSTTWTAFANPTPVGERQGGAEKCSR